ncbi:MAG TPA: serine protease [Anaerolineae bacterium]|nr:serine protease [Anaerolineae bacterium]
MKKRGFLHVLTLVLIAMLLMLATSACGGDQPPPDTPEALPASGKGGEIGKGDETEEPERPQAVSSLDKVKTATIQIEAQGTFIDPDFGLLANVAGRGSGFIFDTSGLAITNNHVVAGAALLKVWVGGERDPVNARVLGVSECFDLAVIKIEGDDFPYLEWHEGDIDVGLDVYTAGFPLGDPEFTLTRGIVSKAQADGESTWSSIDYVLEHDATINPGNSGGPLVDGEGRVVGINYAGIWDANQFFAISRDQAEQIIDKLSEGDDIHTIGINAVAVSNSSGTITGIWVSSVVSGSPADDAGIQPGDIITNMEGLTLAMDGTMADYCDILRTHGQESTLSIEVLRYSSGDILAGQINGRQLAVVSSGGGPPGGGIPSGGVGYGSYVTVQDNSGALMVDVPQEWSDVDGSDWYYDDVVYTLSIWAAPDLNAFTDTWTAPGMKFDVFDDVTYFGGRDGLLQNRMDWLSDSCSFEGLYNYSDPLYIGQYAIYNNCGGSGGASYVTLAAVPLDSPSAYLILVEVQIVSDPDWDAFQKITDTFYVDSSLIGVSVPSGGDYMMVTDDYGALELEIPNWWTDVDGSAWVYDGDVVGASIWAAPDLDGFVNTWDTPGVMFDVSDDIADWVGYVELLDLRRQEMLDYCELDGRYDYEDALYRGKYDLFHKCGGAGGPWYMVLSAVSQYDQFSYLILVEAQVITDEDWDHAQHVLDTFIVVGELP